MRAAFVPSSLMFARIDKIAPIATILRDSIIGWQW